VEAVLVWLPAHPASKSPRIMFNQSTGRRHGFTWNKSFIRDSYFILLFNLRRQLANRRKYFE
jgi:hypothetical protein